MAFAKGQSGNPQGRRREKPFADALRMELAAAGADHKALRGIAAQLIQAALEGKMDAIKEIADRMDGKPRQEVDADVSHDIADPLKAFMERIAANGKRIHDDT